MAPMTRSWTPKKKTVELQGEPRPSRIRRQHVPAASLVQPKPRNREREMWLGVAGITVLGIAIAVLAVGISDSTSRLSGSAGPAEPETGFRHCYNAGAGDCVRDGDTIWIGGQWAELALDAPEIAGARCTEERRRGIAAATRLREMLNNGEVKLGGAVSGADGTMVRRVTVDGRDVAKAMVAAGLAREIGSPAQGWCG